jgi:hypothetical protein
MGERRGRSRWPAFSSPVNPLCRALVHHHVAAVCPVVAARSTPGCDTIATPGRHHGHHEESTDAWTERDEGRNQAHRRLDPGRRLWETDPVPWRVRIIRRRSMGERPATSPCSEWGESSATSRRRRNRTSPAVIKVHRRLAGLCLNHRYEQVHVVRFAKRSFCSRRR